MRIRFERLKNHRGEIKKHFVIRWIIYRLKNDRDEIKGNN
jgi:hypothetical protein